MTSTEVLSKTGAETPKLDMKLEVVVIPVSDVDRAKRFYDGLGWRLDADYASADGYFRVIQFTPPGSGSSIIFGKNVTAAAPGSVQGLYLIVSDIAAAHADLLGHDVEISEVFHDGAGVYAGQDEPYLFGRVRASGRDPEQRSYRSFASFRDPDGNGWLLQEITARLPGRVETARPSPRRSISRRRCVAPRPLTASMKSALGSGTRTGPTGTPRILSPSRPAGSRRRSALCLLQIPCPSSSGPWPRRWSAGSSRKCRPSWSAG